MKTGLSRVRRPRMKPGALIRSNYIKYYEWTVNDQYNIAGRHEKVF